MTSSEELQQKALFYSTCLANHLSNDETAVTLTVDQLAHFMVHRIGCAEDGPMEVLAQAFGIAEFICLQRDYLLKATKEAIEQQSNTSCKRADELKQALDVYVEKYNKELRESDFWQKHAQELTQQVRDLQVKLDKGSR